MKRGVLLVAHGTVDDLAELPPFLANIRRGHAPPAELVAEVTRRYRAIGGSPLNAINLEVAAALEAKLGVTTRLANRLWRPYPKDVLRELAKEGIAQVAVVPLAQHSASVYGEAALAAAKELASEGLRVELACASNWGQEPGLLRAFARRIADTLGGAGGDTTVILSAHSLPKFIVDAGDPYEKEVRASADAIARIVGGAARWSIAFQSQGMSTGPGGRPVEWLGPDLTASLDEAKAAGSARVVVAPVGFLADHVEILYDLDIEAKGWSEARGLAFSRTESLNASPDLIDALAEVARPLLEGGAG